MPMDASNRRWAWDEFPLSRRSKGNQVFSDFDNLPPGQVMLWWHKYEPHYRSHSRQDDRKYLPLGWRAYIPNPRDCQRAQLLFPESKTPLSPNWLDVQAKLLAAGRTAEELEKVSAPALLQMLATVCRETAIRELQQLRPTCSTPVQWARRFVAVLEDIIARIDAANLPQLPLFELRPMVREAGRLAMALGEDGPTAWIVQQDSGTSLSWRTQYGVTSEHNVERITAETSGIFKGLPTAKHHFTHESAGKLVAALREWQRWAQAFVDENANADRLPGDATTPRAPAKRTKTRSDKPSKTVRIRLQRNKFSEPRRRKDATWQAIYDEYRKKYSNDPTATADNLRHAFERDPDKTDSSDS